MRRVKHLQKTRANVEAWEPTRFTVAFCSMTVSSMSGAVDIVSYFASRASRSAADVRQGARKAVSIAYEVLWAPVRISKAIISIGLGLPPVRALVLAPLLLLQRSCSVGLHLRKLRVHVRDVKRAW